MLMPDRVYNFSAGPAMLPEPVLKEAQQALLDWGGRGISILSVSHRSEAFLQLIAETETDLRELLQIPDDYHVLFFTGGGSMHFAMVAMNLLNQGQGVYLNSGYWAAKAAEEAKRYGEVVSLGEGWQTMLTSHWALPKATDYVHLTDNETIDGCEWPQLPTFTQKVPIIADMSSSILSKPLKVADYAMIYAGAQKNIGPSGFSVAIVRKDLLFHPPLWTPTQYRYSNYIQTRSIVATPNTFAWYMAGRFFAWLKAEGGLATMAERNQKKAALLYRYLDQTEFYTTTVPASCRSRMNVPFCLPRADLTSTFLTQAARQSLVGLAGHWSVGGCRASIYNAMPLRGVEALVAFMRDFEQKYG